MPGAFACGISYGFTQVPCPLKVTHVHCNLESQAYSDRLTGKATYLTAASCCSMVADFDSSNLGFFSQSDMSVLACHSIWHESRLLPSNRGQSSLQPCEDWRTLCLAMACSPLTTSLEHHLSNTDRLLLQRFAMTAHVVFRFTFQVLCHVVHLTNIARFS